MKKMNDKSNWNRLALQGIDVDDMDFVREFNLDPSIAYTPKINPELIRAWANSFSQDAFKFRLEETINRVWSEHIKSCDIATSDLRS